MTQKVEANKITKLNSTFVVLDDTNQDYILAIMQALRFAQKEKQSTDNQKSAS